MTAASGTAVPNFTFSLFGRTGLDAIALKSMLATIALALAALQVLLAVWIYRKLPLAGSPPRAVRPAHRAIGFGLFALTVPIAVHCLLAYGVQLHQPPGGCAFDRGLFFLRRLCGEGAAGPAPGGCRGGCCRLPGARSLWSSACWYTSALWYYNGFQLPAL